MRLERTLAVLNEMQAAGVISSYAIGGAVAAFVFIEPGATFDLDIFIGWSPGASGLLTLTPIYEYLRERGYFPRGAAVDIEGWDVQFLVPGTPLVEEALKEAGALEISAIPCRVFTKEHLMAISLETGRPKDSARLIQFIHESRPDKARFMSILARHDLRQKWHEFEARFMISL